MVQARLRFSSQHGDMDSQRRTLPTGFFTFAEEGTCNPRKRRGPPREFEKIVDFRGRDATSELIPLSQLQLARAYALQKDLAKARAAYQDFLALWKDADFEIAILKEAKSEHAKLE